MARQKGIIKLDGTIGDIRQCCRKSVRRRADRVVA